VASPDGVGGDGDGESRASLIASVFDVAASTTDGICTTDREGRITFVNKSLATLVGIDEDEAIGRPVFEFLVDDVRAEWDDLVAQRAPLPNLGELELRRIDGGTVPVVLSISPLGGDTFDGVLAVVRDMTEERRLAAELAEREASLSTLLANVPGMVYRCLHLPDWPMQFVSDEATRLIGWTPAELIADPHLYGSRIVDDDQRTVETAIAAALEGSDTFALRYRLRHRDGSIRWVWERGRITRRATDAEPGVLEGLVIDITRQVDSSRALAESEERYRALIESLPGGVLVSRHGRVVFHNATAARLLGVGEDDLLGREVLPLIHPADQGQANEIAQLTETLRVRAPIARYRLVAPGAAGEVAALSTPTTYGGEPASQTFFWDVSAERRVAALQAAQDRTLDLLAAGESLEVVLEGIVTSIEAVVPGRVAAITLAEHGRIVTVVGSSLPEGFAAALASKLDESSIDAVPCGLALRTGQAVIVEDLAEGDWLPELKDVFARAGLRSCWTMPISTQGEPPTATIALLAGSISAPTPEEEVVHDHFRRLVAIALEHDRARRRADAQLGVDALTGLLSRTAALELIDQRLSLRRERNVDVVLPPVAVLMVGLDDFATLTDALGEAATDEILKAVAVLLEQATNDNDIVARFAPTTFLVATDTADEHELDERAARLQQSLAAPFRAGSAEVFLTASIGAAASVSGEGNAASLVASADAALYHSMRSGPGGQLRFDERLRQQASRRMLLEPALARALDAAEFRVHYQPQIDLRSGVVVGLEALVRWLHPEHGLVAPDDFIPLAERNGLIVPIGSWVLQESCRQAAVWRDLRPERPPFVSVNLSARQLSDPALVDRVRAAVEAVDLDPALLRLEITETAVMTDPASATVILRELRAIGVHLSIDDFGTGYSSLVYLKRFPVDELKIDRVFVDGVGSRADDTAIVAGVTSLARSLGLTSLAEGVEHIEQAEELARLGCDVAQGYYWSPPMPADDVTSLIVTGTAPITVDHDDHEAAPEGGDEVLVALVHELRGPLTVVQGYGELLEADVPPAAAVPALKRNVDRMAAILQSIDDVNSLERGALALRLGDEKLGSVVRGVIEGFAASRPKAKIVLECDPPDLDSLATRIDRVRIEQVLWNLVANALRYGPAEGPVVIRITRDDDTISCAVIDQGPGLPPEEAPRLFRKFARGDRRIAGSGLGLYLARGIARAHGGDVTYERASEGGAEFRLSLPLR
jgi:diguanylate cyclase (GGDEF)-like protein/PAS domain S-box-containing protein